MSYRTFAIALTVLTALVAPGCGEPQHDDHAAADPPAAAVAAESGARATAVLAARSGSQVGGTADFVATDGEVTLTLSLTGVPAGEHAVHLHEIGDCSADDGTSAGGHWNPTGENHGKFGHDGFHLGDIGNVTAPEDGIVQYTMSTDLWSIGTGDPDDILGRAVIVHADVDDYMTQPTGAAGGRIACGVVEPAE